MSRNRHFLKKTFFFFKQSGRGDGNQFLSWGWQSVLVQVNFILNAVTENDRHKKAPYM